MQHAMVRLLHAVAKLQHAGNFSICMYMETELQVIVDLFNLLSRAVVQLKAFVTEAYRRWALHSTSYKHGYR